MSVHVGFGSGVVFIPSGLRHLPFPSPGPAFSSSCGILLLIPGDGSQSIPITVFSWRFSLEVVCGGLPVVVVELARDGDLPVAIGPWWWCGHVVICVAPLSIRPLLGFPFRRFPLVLGSLRWLCIVVGFLFDVIVGLLLNILAFHVG